MRSLVVMSLMLVVLGAVCASADIIYVNPGGSIQTGIDTAAPGDTVLVNDGTYNEAGIVMKPGVKLRGASDDTTAVLIDAGNPPIMDGIFYLTGCGDTTEISGMTLARGTSASVMPYQGGGMKLVNSSPVLRNLMIIECSALGQGGGVFCDNSSPEMTHVCLKGNAAYAGGGGGMALINGSDPHMLNCSLIMNSAQAGGNISCDQSSPMLTDCIFVGGATQNDGDGMYLTDNSHAQLTNVSFGMMQSNLPGSYGQCVYMEVNSDPVFTNVCFHNSGLGYGPLVYSQESTSVPTFTCCNCYAWGPNSSAYGGFITDPTGTDGNIKMDPLYCDALNWDLHVDAASPNLPTSPHNTCGTLIGCFGEGCDSPVESRSWGQIKGMWR
ncbi:MAG: hypothetical protein GF400_06305 [Candidatus Eisenbacteria bacterium]|nr:hypothetical protein [Candidatus Eisenbacteria bacterium]